MRESRSFWNIEQGKSRPLGLELVSPTGAYFFLYAAKFIALQRNLGEFIKVKNKDRHPEDASYHHPGEIYGRLVSIDSEFDQISLYFGYAGQVIEHDRATDRLLDLHSEQHHLIPANEISSLATVLLTMYVQRERFRELKLFCGTSSSFQ